MDEPKPSTDWTYKCSELLKDREWMDIYERTVKKESGVKQEVKYTFRANYELIEEKLF